MKCHGGRILGLGSLVVFGAAWGAGGNGDDDHPPTGYKYYALVANVTSDNISAFSINTTTGALTAVAPSPLKQAL